MKNLTEDMIPCWTKLVWQEDPPAINILVHQDIVRKLHQIPPDSPMINLYLRDLEQGTTFSNATAGGWGFDGCLKQAPATPDGFVPFSFEIPLVKKTSNGRCANCSGTGTEELGNGKCPHCIGGKPWYYDRRTIWPISASMTMLTSRLGHFPPKHDTSATTPQLLMFETCATIESCAISGKFSAPLVDWFRHLGEQKLPGPTKAMVATWSKMRGGPEKMVRLYAQITDRNGWLNVQAPGNACNINPHSGFVPAIGGYEFCDHNTENPFQQLTLLAALAAIETEARQALGY
jgi:hypothetical protein